MTEWEVFGVIAAIVALGVTIIKPILSLNSSIVRLTERMEQVSEGLDDLNAKNTENHKRIWDRVDEQGAKLKTHEERIVSLENWKRFQKGE